MCKYNVRVRRRCTYARASVMRVSDGYVRTYVRTYVRMRRLFTYVRASVMYVCDGYVRTYVRAYVRMPVRHKHARESTIEFTVPGLQILFASSQALLQSEARVNMHKRSSKARRPSTKVGTVYTKVHKNLRELQRHGLTLTGTCTITTPMETWTVVRATAITCTTVHVVLGGLSR